MGGFAYAGSADNTGSVGPMDLNRKRYGADVKIYWGNSNIFGGWIRGSDESLEGSLVTDKEYDLGFAELNQVVYPWLIGLVRYERAEPNEEAALERAVVGFTALYRANIKFVIETSFDPSNAELTNLRAQLDFAM